MKTKRILITLLICLLATSVLFGMIACKKQGDRPLPDPVDPSQSTNDPVRIVREMLEALPDAATFGAADVPALENALEAYANLSDDEKKDVSYAKAEALLKKAVYLDASTVSFFPQSKDGFTLKPYLTGKNVLTVKVGEDDLYYGQYTVKANEVEISTAVLKKYVPSVVDLEITTDVGANYIYKIYAGMKIDEAYEVKSCTDTELDDNVGDGLAFIAEKGVGSKTLLCFSKYDGTLKYDFSEGR